MTKIMIDIEKRKERLYTFLADLEQDMKILQDNILKIKEDLKDINSKEELKMFADEVDLECGLKHIELFWRRKQ